MSQCSLDHTIEDVKKKYESQLGFLPAEIKLLLGPFLEKRHSQATLNEIFHLLKKYDLSSEEEKAARNNQLLLHLQNA
jgi:hypothetical protein